MEEVELSGHEKEFARSYVRFLDIEKDAEMIRVLCEGNDARSTLCCASEEINEAVGTLEEARSSANELNEELYADDDAKAEAVEEFVNVYLEAEDRYERFIYS